MSWIEIQPAGLLLLTKPFNIFKIQLNLFLFKGNREAPDDSSRLGA